MWAAVLGTEVLHSLLPLVIIKWLELDAYPTVLYISSSLSHVLWKLWQWQNFSTKLEMKWASKTKVNKRVVNKNRKNVNYTCQLIRHLTCTFCTDQNTTNGNNMLAHYRKTFRVPFEHPVSILRHTLSASLSPSSTHDGLLALEPILEHGSMPRCNEPVLKLWCDM